MNNMNNLPPNKLIIEEIEILELINLFWDQKKTIILCICITAVASIIYSLSLPNIYTSKALLAPTQQSLGDSLASYRGLAGLAGINLPSSNAKNLTEEATETLSSFVFFRENVLPNIFLPDLVAVKKWHAQENKLIYENNIYDSLSNTWVRKANFPRKSVPSAQESHEIFIDAIFSKSKDNETGFIRLSIEHQSPYIAKEWLDIILNGINERLREDQKRRALISIEYLNDQISQTSLTEIKQVLSTLVQQETEKLMLVESNKDYVFKIIDAPIVPELKSYPNRAIICIVGTILGGILGLMIVFVRHYFFSSTKNSI